MDLNALSGLTAMQRFIQSGYRVDALRTNTLLRKDDWLMLDEWVVGVSSTILNGIADLQAMGLSIANGGLGTMIHAYNQVTAFTPATITMDPRVDAYRDRVDYKLVNVPVPCIISPFEINIRELAASRQHGHALDRDHVDEATRVVGEAIESMLFNGASLVVQGTPIYGYTTHPMRNTAAGASWAVSTNIYPNVLTMIAGIEADGYQNGPYRLYLHPTQYNQAFALNANTSQPIISTIQGLPGFGPGSVKKAGSLTAGQAVLVSMNRNIVDLSVGQSIMPIEWQEKGGLVSEFVVFGCMVPRVKSTADGRSGIYHMTGLT